MYPIFRKPQSTLRVYQDLHPKDVPLQHRGICQGPLPKAARLGLHPSLLHADPQGLGCRATAQPQAVAVLVAEKQELQQQVAALKRETELLRFKLLSDEQGLSTNSTTPAEGTSPQGTPSPWGYASPHGAWAGMSGGPRRLGYTAE
ncbi:hypothetical protein HaLaN_08677 [Haematococcus lacustris]|uniref:Uncharacterized protein n=1 Tax=Haematococcus lacustris TaxID=44745 RepID=A0A699Z1M9_HAELA|nr:hypothetical protein HaLaN_08677 [Haematococcus lacustris]